MISKQPKHDMKAQLKELATNDTITALLPNLHKLAVIFLSLPVATASVERSFSQMKMIKTRLRNRIGELSLSNLMKIAIESPDTLSDSDLEEIVYGVGKTEELLSKKLMGRGLRNNFISIVYAFYIINQNSYITVCAYWKDVKGGTTSFQGGASAPSHPPPNETLHV